MLCFGWMDRVRETDRESARQRETESDVFWMEGERERDRQR